MTDFEAEPDAIVAAGPVIRAIEAVGGEVFVVGSLASSLHGIFRSTADADLAANLPADAVEAFIAEVGEDVYYVSIDAVRDALQRHGSFNLIHLETMTKVDVFFPPMRGYDRVCFERATPAMFGERNPVGPYRVTTPEDVVLKKLDWFRQGHGTSDRQWNDILSVLRVQHGRLDLDYMRRWADELGVRDLLDKALADPQASDG